MSNTSNYYVLYTLVTTDNTVTHTGLHHSYNVCAHKMSKIVIKHTDKLVIIVIHS